MKIRTIVLLLAAAFLLVACGEEAAPTATTVPATPTTQILNIEPTNTSAPEAATATPAAPTPNAAEAVATETATAAPEVPTETAAPAAPTATTAAPAATATEAAPAPTETAAPAAEAGPLVEQTIVVPDSLKSGVFEGERTLNLPAAFNVSLFANGLNDSRWIVTGPDGNLWVSERGAGRILIYKPQGADEAPAEPTVFISGLNAPHGIAFYQDWVYISETTRVLRVKNNNGQPAGDPETIISGIPSGGHSTRTLLFTPDDKLLVSIGSSCNVCNESNDMRAAVMIYDPDGSNGRLYATGLRNAVGLALNPDTQKVWFTNNGRDNLGDNIPKEIMGTLIDGAFYGWPDCYGDKVYDTDFGGDASKCDGMTVPEVAVQAHSAPLGNTFLPSSGVAQPYAGDMIVAYHGSWNRSVPTGYKVVRVPMTGGQVDGDVADFITGWQAGGDVWGRPVDAAYAPDGALYITDDQAGAIYRVYPSGQ